MSMLPFAVLWLVLAGVGVANFGLQSRRRLVNPLNALTVLSVCALWLWGRPAAADSFSSGNFLSYSFAVPSALWQLTGVVLCVLAIVVGWNWLTESGLTKTLAPGNSALPLLLSAGLLPFLWSAEPLTAATMFGLFAAAYGLILWSSRDHKSFNRLAFGHLVTLLLLPLLLIWFADAVALSGSVHLVWAELSGMAVLVAGAALLGAWPLAGWRHSALRVESTVALALVALPPIGAAAVLLPVAQQQAHSGAQMALAVIIGFLSLLMALRWIWRNTKPDQHLVFGLAVGLSGLVLLTAVFATESALLAATRMVVFVPMLAWFLVQLSSQVSKRETSEIGTEPMRGQSILAAVVWLLVLGLPLTVGFATISGLYVAWQAQSQFLLSALLSLLLTIWSALLFLPVVRAIKGTRQSPGAPAGAFQLSRLILLIPLAALLQINLTGLAEMTMVTWIAWLVPFVLGPPLAWFLGDRLDLAESPTVDLIPRERLAPVLSRARRGWTFAGDSVADAGEILEGTNGLFWVLVIIAALILIT